MEFITLMAANASGGETPGMLDMGTLFLPLLIMLPLFYLLFFLPEKKRKKRAAEMLNNIQIADEVVTSGGIIGRVIDVKKGGDTIVIETGSDKTRIRVLKSCIIENRTIHDD